MMKSHFDLEKAILEITELEASAERNKDIAKGLMKQAKEWMDGAEASLAKADEVKARILAALKLAGQKSAKTEHQTISVMRGKKSLHIVEDAVSDEYKKTIEVVDRAKIKDDLENGVILNFASLVRGEDYLTIKGRK